MHTFYMDRALALAKHGLGWVAPNPLVGAVLVREEKIIGEGWHAKYGDVHAEVAAIRDAQAKGSDVAGATLYCTLEPCNHDGKQPACTRAILEAGIREVFFAASDTNMVARGGADFLRSQGISVVGGICHDAAEYQNRIFFGNHKNKRPYVLVKVGVSKDNMLTSGPGERVQITGPEAMEYAQELRQLCDAILVGGHTVVIDNPSLTVRSKNLPAPVRQPLRVVVDGRGTVPVSAKIFETMGSLVITTDVAPVEFVQGMRGRADVALAPAKNGIVEVAAILDILAERGITSVLVEGGASVLEQFLASGLVDEWVVIRSAKVFGRGVPFLKNPETLGEKMTLKKTERLGADTAEFYFKH